MENLRGPQMGIEFGSQIRSYVLHPYRLVKVCVSLPKAFVAVSVTSKVPGLL